MTGLVRWYQRLVTSPQQQHDPAISSTFRLAELPSDVVELTLAFLTGLDLLPLSHVNRQLYHGLLANDTEVWQRLAPPCSPLHTLQLRAPPRRTVARLLGLGADETPPTAKKRYLARRAVQFHGVRPHRILSHKRGGAIPTPSFLEFACATGGSFSFDLVFALLPALDDPVTYAGGILLGAQSGHASVFQHAFYHQPFVHTDPDGNLYCSVMRQKPIVAEHLEFERWYHVALVFDMARFMKATQRVYLDGELVHTADGWRHDEWCHLSHAQLGTGYITGGPFGLNQRGWYGFNGLIDECRFWSRALQPDEVRRLTHGGSDGSTSRSTCSWSMRDVATERAIAMVSLVHSTSPSERVVRHVKVTGALSSDVIPPQAQAAIRIDGRVR